MHETELVSQDAQSTEALATITKAEIDMQIATAKRYPRVLSKVKADMLSFATLDEETAQSCFYTLKRKEKNGSIKLIQGPSIRMGEIALSCYGNIKAGARIISNDGKTLVAQGVCHDLEKNVTIDMQTTRRITNKEGRTFSDDMQIVTGNAACAIALRNAIFKVVPLALVKPVFEEAKRVAIGDVKSLAAKREKVVSKLKAMGASEENILAAVDARKVEDIDLEKLEILIGLGTALKDGETTLEEAFPTPKTEPTKEATPAPEAKPDPTPEAKAEAGAKVVEAAADPLEAADKKAAAPTIQDQLVELIKKEGFTFAELSETALRFGWIDKPIDSPSEFPEATAKALVKNPKRLLAGLTEGREK